MRASHEAAVARWIEPPDRLTGRDELHRLRVARRALALRVTLSLFTAPSAAVSAPASPILTFLEPACFAWWLIAAVVEAGSRRGGGGCGGGRGDGRRLGVAGCLQLSRCGRRGRGRRRVGRWRDWCRQLAGARHPVVRCVARFARSVAIGVRLALLGGGTGGTGSATSTGGTPAFVHAGAVGQGECSRVTRWRARGNARCECSDRVFADGTCSRGNATRHAPPADRRYWIKSDATGAFCLDRLPTRIPHAGSGNGPTRGRGA